MDIKHISEDKGLKFAIREDMVDGFKFSPGIYVSSAFTEIDANPPEWLMEGLSRPQKHYIYFCNFGTISLFRHKGYGRKLLQDVKKYYEGCVVYLAVSSCGKMTNEQLIEFYTSEGFKLIEHNNNYPYKGYPVMAIEL